MDNGEFQGYLDSKFDRLEQKLERVELKLDNHLERLSHAETSIDWLKGFSKLITTIILSIAGFLAVAVFNNLGKH